MDKKWYVVHTKTGYELKAKEALEEKIKNENMGEYVEEIIVPMENVIEIVKGKKQKKAKQIFPGYLLVKMKVTDQSWHFIKNSPYVTGFVGKKTKPIPLTESEAEKLIASCKEGKLSSKPKIEFEIGDNVRVVEGPFVNFTGTVDDVKPEKGKIKVLVSIFGRPTPVEVSFEQVEKI